MAAPEPATIGALLGEAEALLAGAGADAARLDARLLLASVLAVDMAQLYAWPDRVVAGAERARYRALVERRAGGVPVAQLTGRREFWSLSLRVTADTLVPRPETELLVEWALQLLPAGERRRVADLGTGSGAIAAALASERPLLELVASDRSRAALAVAAANFAALGLARVRTRQGDWCAALPAGQRFDLIVSNPPYVAAGDPHLLRDGLRCEPAQALVAGPDGLDALRAITAQAGAWLRPGGWLLLEHGYDQQAAVATLLRRHGFEAVTQRRDLAGRPRASGGRQPA